MLEKKTKGSAPEEGGVAPGDIGIVSMVLVLAVAYFFLPSPNIPTSHESVVILGKDKIERLFGPDYKLYFKSNGLIHSVDVEDTDYISTEKDALRCVKKMAPKSGSLFFELSDAGKCQ